MGRFIVVPGVNPPEDYPLINDLDPILPDQGALVLIDPGHPVQPWAEGVPDSGTATPNLAIDQAKGVLTGINGDIYFTPLFTVGSTFLDHGLLERTEKGGLHAARDTANGDSNTVFTIPFVSTFYGDSTGLGSIAGHSFFVSFWGRVTKPYAAGYTPGLPAHSRFGSSAQMYGFYTNRSTDTSLLPSDSRRIGYRESGSQSLASSFGPIHQNIGISSINGTISGAPIYVFGILNGSAGNKGGMILYRYYMEDLTVSGRSYAEVDAIDTALYVQDVLTPGGRYYDDDWTDPDDYFGGS